MDTNLIYMPAFRARQQENLVLSSFNFGEKMYPLVEIVKEHDRKRHEDRQRPFQEIYGDLINSINANKVFIDLPLGLKETGSMVNEILSFSRGVISHLNKRSEYINHLAGLRDRIIPVVSSYLRKTGETNTIAPQVDLLRPSYNQLAFRSHYSTFFDDWDEIEKFSEQEDYFILDLDTIPPYPSSPVLKKMVDKLRYFEKCTKIVLRSSINADIQNVSLIHDEVVYEADNSLIDTYRNFFSNAFGDYAGIKKDDLTSGGTISPGFIYYDAIENQYYGYRANAKRLEEFESTIVPSVLASEATERMAKSKIPFLTKDNMGWQTLQRINSKEESGKSQAKFKRISMEHYLYCIKTRIDSGDLSPRINY